jgi:hypothetical protein
VGKLSCALAEAPHGFSSGRFVGEVEPRGQLLFPVGEVGCELVWATTWMDEANECVAPWLGLPALPVVNWPEPDPDDLPGVHWKTRPLVDRAAGRAFVWLDDEVTDADRRWVAEHHPGRALLHRVDPRHGLRDADFVIVEEWLQP